MAGKKRADESLLILLGCLLILFGVIFPGFLDRLGSDIDPGEAQNTLFRLAHAFRVSFLVGLTMLVVGIVRATRQEQRRLEREQQGPEE